LSLKLLGEVVGVSSFVQGVPINDCFSLLKP